MNLQRTVFVGPNGVRTGHVLTGLDDRAANMVAFTRVAIELLGDCLG